MEHTVTGQVSDDAAQIYDEVFVPAVFAPWAAVIAERAKLRRGERTLDVACGTGALARELAKRVLPGGSVDGVDRNEGMISVARARRPELRWHVSPAESLPFADGAFDVVASQFGLMFFEDKAGAIAEMWRVLRPGGRLLVAVFDELENVRGHAALSRLLTRLYGDRIGAEMSVPFALGNAATLAALFESAGVPGVDIHSPDGAMTFPSVREWIRLEVEGWTLGELLDGAQVERLLREAEREMAPFVLDDGRCSFPAAAQIVSAAKADGA